MVYRTIFSLLPLLLGALFLTGALPFFGGGSTSEVHRPAEDKDQPTIAEEAKRNGVTPGHVMSERAAERISHGIGMGPSQREIRDLERAIEKAEKESARRYEEMKLQASGWKGGAGGAGWAPTP